MHRRHILFEFMISPKGIFVSAQGGERQMIHKRYVVSLLFWVGVCLVLPTQAAFAGSPPNLSIFNAQEDSKAVGTVRLESNQAGVLNVSWDSPTDAPGDYRVNWARVDEDFPTWTDSAGNAFPTTPSYTITGLDQGVRYKVRVRARYQPDTPGAWSAVVEAGVASGVATNTPTATPTATPTPTPTAMPADTPTPTATPVYTPTPTATAAEDSKAVGTVRLESNQAGVLNVSWDSPTNAPVDYRVSWARTGEDFPSWTVSAGNAFPTTPSYTITGLDQGIRYKVKVRARYQPDTPGAWSAVVEADVASGVATNTPTATPTDTPTPTPTATPAEVRLADTPTPTPTATPAEVRLADTPTPTPTATAGTDDSADRIALVALYNATGGANWNNNTNWLSEKPLSDWHGISTDSHGRVSSISLSVNWLSGTIPPQLGSLSNLKHLEFLSNDLSGAIPSQLGNLSNLEVLHLGWNDLSGAIPSQLGNLSNLKALFLNSNNLTGAIPSQLGQLSKLEVLALSFNELSGAIPSQLGNLSSLKYLFLGINNLTGTIPPQLEGLSNLVYLSLKYNQLSGCIPRGLRDVSDNDLHLLGLPNCAPTATPTPTATP